MNFKDVTGVFSRYFVAGFLLPAFFGLLAASLTVAPAFDPIVKGEAKAGRLAVLAFAALLLGLLFLVMRIPIIRLFEGYPLERLAGSTPSGGKARFDWIPPLLRPGQYPHALYSALVERQQRRQSDLAARVIDGPEVLRELDRNFPPAGTKLLPTRFGNVIRAFEYHGTARWGLSTLGAWPRIAALLSDREVNLHADAETDLAFCLNSCVATIVLAVAVAVDGVMEETPLAVAGAILPALFAYGWYLLAVPAAMRWGVEVRASVDLNRLELYRRLGLHIPRSFSREREMARALSRFLDYGNEQLSDGYWSAVAPTD